MPSWLHNICLLSDSYKTSHHRMLPPNTEHMYAYFESREGAKFPETVFYGLQYFLKEYLEGDVVGEYEISAAEKRWAKHIGKGVFNEAGWRHIAKEHAGFLPVRIRAVPEGTVVPTGNVLMTVEGTDKNLPWLTGWLETILTQVWCPSTVATQSREMKKIILKYLEKTGDPSLIDYKLHCFGFRGVGCPEYAAIAGSAHLVNFLGTDTMPGVLLAEQFYNEEMAGFSIPAAEHSTVTAWGEEYEVDAIRNILEQYPSGLIACPGDSYDIFRGASEIWGGALKDLIINRDGVSILRPDSGVAVQVLPKVFSILGEKFGYTTNNKGYKLLNPKIRLIQGDGIKFDTLDGILDCISCQGAGWSTDNLALGSGGGLLQKISRDTQNFAFKCCDATIDGEHRVVYKTAPGKNSKRGRLKLVVGANGFETVPESDPRPDNLETVFENGVVVRTHNFKEIRKRASL